MKQMREQGVGSAIELESAQAKARSLEAQVEAQKKEVDRRKQELDYATIRAEISGRIGRALMTQGNLVNAGGSDPLLTTITKVNPMSVYFNVDERALQRYAKTRPISATRPRDGVLKDLQIKFAFGLETDEGYPHEAILDFADNAVNRDTGTILARGEVKNETGLFVPGSRVRIRLPVGEPQNAVLVPDTAILTDQTNKYVLVVDDKNVVHRRDINPGRLLDDGMRVLLPNAKGENLTGNDWIVVLGLQMARMNYPVEPIKPSTTQPVQTAAGL
jgi:RND family efflux transporter MFP subunit